MKSAVDIAKDFTELVLNSIRLDETNPMKPKKQDLLTLSVRLPRTEKHRFERFARRYGVEQTQVVRKAVSAILDHLEDQERQIQQLPRHAQAPLFSESSREVARG